MPEIRRRLENSQRLALQSYAWVDRPRGIAQIPIDLAIRQIAEQGLPTFEPTAAPNSEEAPQ
jgi:hypothetical protein